MGDGAVGVVYGGTLEYTNIIGNTRTRDAVIKFAFSEKQQERMRHEYLVYQHLVASNVMGIPTVYGLFRDLVADGPLALVLSREGVDLWHARRSNLDSYDVDVPQVER